MRRLSVLWILSFLLLAGCQSEENGENLENSAVEDFQPVYNSSKTIRNNGSADDTRNGVFTNIPVNKGWFSNTDQISTTIYDGVYISDINASLAYTSIARADLNDLVCTITW